LNVFSIAFLRWHYHNHDRSTIRYLGQCMFERVFFERRDTIKALENSSLCVYWFSLQQTTEYIFVQITRKKRWKKWSEKGKKKKCNHHTQHIGRCGATEFTSENIEDG